MKNYFYSLPEDLQELILNINTKMNVFDTLKKNRHYKKFYFILYDINEGNYFFKTEKYLFLKDIDINERYNDFNELYDRDYKSVDGFSDNFLYIQDRVYEIKNKYPEIVIKDLYPSILDIDFSEAREIERIRKFLFMIS